MKIVIPLLLLLIGLPAAAKNKDPQSKQEADARAAYAKQVEREVELDGWKTTMWAVGKNPCGYICKGGEHISLRVWIGGAPAEGMMRFYKSEIEPRAERLRDLGFIAVEIRSDYKSSNFPDGVWNIPIQ